eukprot:TRINITY_DN24436_c0_g1_i1.p1 TRINITY_DN24436_c0_g1~~TRINITY_DN24436_c0_g1_i1.p1  ORF type:complete len:419 (+),score=44.63 TRINITY_DN24436_c0_g1_i1:47-1303(+)
MATEVKSDVEIKKIILWSDGDWITGLETQWKGGSVSKHGATGSNCVEVPFDEGEYLVNVGIKCCNGERNTYVSAVTLHTNLAMKTSWVGGTTGKITFLKKEGYKIIGFTGRSSHCLDALGVLTVPLTGDTQTVSRTHSFGGPSGVAFADFSAVDYSQLSQIVLRSAFKEQSTEPAHSNAQQLLESARHLFTNMQRACHGENAPELLTEAERFFKVQIKPASLQDPPTSPLVSSERELISRSGKDTYPLKWDAFTAGFTFTGDVMTAVCRVSAGWRSVITRTPLPIAESRAVEVILSVRDCRILAIGVSPAEALDKLSFVGETHTSIAFQSTGHTVTSSDLIPNFCPFGAKDTISLLVTSESIAFYKNREFMCVETLPCKEPYLTVSGYLGPNEFSIVGCLLWKESDVMECGEFPPKKL